MARSKYVEAPAPGSVYCRWCDSPKMYLGGVLLCPHCDAPYDTAGAVDHGEHCMSCAIERGRTDTRPLEGGQ